MQSSISRHLLLAVPLALAALTTTASADGAGEQLVVATEPPVNVRYPRAAIARSLTLPSNILMAGVDETANRDFTAMAGAPIIGYGVTDMFEVQLSYAFAERALEPKGSIAVDIGYVIARGALDGKLEVVARLRDGYSVLDSEATPLMLGLHAQYSVTPWLAVISGTAGTQQLRISLSPDAQMTYPTDLGLPLGIGVQATPHLYLQLDTKLAQLDLHQSANLMIGRDATPLSLTGAYNVVQSVDVQAAVGADMNNAGESLTLLVGARYYAGAL